MKKQEQLTQTLDSLNEMGAYIAQVGNNLAIMLPLNLLGDINPQMIEKYNLRPNTVK